MYSGMEMTKYSIRQATVSDAAIIARHRVGMFRDMGQVPTDALATKLLETSTAALGVLLRERSYIGWLAIAESDRILAGAGANVQSQLPRISHSGIAVTTAPVPLVVNVYTEPDFRGMGIARALMNTLLKWATEHGHDRVVLHASDAGRPLYQSLGFVPTNEMRWSPTDNGVTRMKPD
jgi:GNAT superfamily N-acetyltransferase